MVQLAFWFVSNPMAPHSSTLAWKIPWTEEPGRLQSLGLLRVGHDWASSHSLFTFYFLALEKEMATDTSALAWRIPGTVEPGGLPSQGSHRVGHDWSDLAGFSQHIPGQFSPLESCLTLFPSSVILPSLLQRLGTLFKTQIKCELFQGAFWCRAKRKIFHFLFYDTLFTTLWWFLTHPILRSIWEAN